MTEYNGNRAIGWEDQLEDFPQERYVVLPKGRYTFTVEGFERKQWTSGKLAGANYAELALRLNDAELEGTARVNLTLHPRTMFKVREFFKSIGEDVEDGRPFAPKWNRVMGSRGRCLVEPRAFKGRDGKDMESNDVTSFLPPDEWATSPAEGDGLPF